MKKVLIITNNRKDRSPGQRFRFEQYIDFLNSNGFSCEFSNLLNEKDDKIFYSTGNYFKKAIILLKGLLIRNKNLKKINEFDFVFIFREALYIGSTYFERKIAKKSKFIFDFDDSIWLQNVSEANKKFVFLKNADKTKDLIAISKMVFAGNQYLADYALNFSNNVKIIPTTIDTNEYLPIRKIKSDKIVIGWSGSVTTIQHFKFAIEPLKIIKEKYKNLIEIKVIGDDKYFNSELEIQGLKWQKETEISDLCSFDIGIMPLPDDEWAKGKCGLKGLQYMALEIPTIMSPVGVNSDIIQDDINGCLASSTQDWVDKLSFLIENEELRLKIGREGRQTVIDKYSVEANKELYLKYFQEFLKM